MQPHHQTVIVAPERQTTMRLSGVSFSWSRILLGEGLGEHHALVQNTYYVTCES